MTDLDHALAAMARDLPPDTLRDAEDRHREDPRRITRGTGRALALPRSVEEVAAIVRACFEARVPIIPFGGGTGLVGGQISEDEGALILSLERMSAVREIRPDEGVMIAEAGAILADLQAAAEGADRLFPLSLASEGSARLGGLLGTNAGGTGVLRYGNMRDLTLGVEAVLPDGSVLRRLGRLRKDNTGYDLRHLLIGAEGTLGVVTAAALRLFPRPAERGAAVLAIPSPRAALDLLWLSRERLGDGVSAFELISGVGLAMVAACLPELRQPLAGPPAWSVLLDAGLPAGRPASEVLEDLAAEAMERGLVTDGAIAQSEGQRRDFWSLREHIPEANRLTGAVSSHDVSVPLSEIPALIERGEAAVAALGPLRVNAFGHVGDGNLHVNAFAREGVAREDVIDLRPRITRAVHDIVHDLGGSISAEHGIGRHKAEELVRYADPAKVAAMRAIKAALDPRGIMNPGAVLAMAGGHACPPDPPRSGT